MKRWHWNAKGLSALDKQQNLLQHSLAVWPRRGKTLLEVNCGQGILSPLLWECGFDLTATELRPELRTRAAAVMGSRAEITAAADDHLPFEDSSFDGVVLHLSGGDKKKMEVAVREALRVTSGGLAVTFWNSASLAYLLHCLQGRKDPWPGPVYSWWRVWRMLKEMGGGKACGMSTLAGPRCLWNSSCSLGGCIRKLPLPLGAWCVVRLDLGPARPVTPLPLKIKGQRLRRPEPALEYGSKNSLNSQ